MPRKNARPAARKRQAQLRARLGAADKRRPQAADLAAPWGRLARTVAAIAPLLPRR